MVSYRDNETDVHMNSTATMVTYKIKPVNNSVEDELASLPLKEEPIYR